MMDGQPELVSRADAIARGLNRYFTGKPCKHGHLSERVTTTYDCIECRRTIYRERDADNHRARLKKYRDNNLDKARQSWNEYYARNRDSRLARNRELYDPEKKAHQWAKYSKENRDAIRSRGRAYQKKNAEKFAAKSALLRAGFRARNSELDCLAFDEAFALCKTRAIETGVSWSVDHMIPLRAKNASGLHCAANLQVIPSAINTRKGNRMWLTQPGEWIAHL